MPKPSRELLNKLWETAKNNKLPTALGAYMAYSDFQGRRQEGQGVVMSALGAISEGALTYIAPWKLTMATMLPELGGAFVDAYDSLSQMSRQLQRRDRNVPFAGATFLDSQQTYTMRQAGQNLARRAQYAAQTTMGNEAASIAYWGH